MGKEGSVEQHRGLTDDPTTVPQAQHRTAKQKVTHLKIMLGQIANFCPIISHKTITHNSTSVDYIWQTIHAHFGFQSTRGYFLNLANRIREIPGRPVPTSDCLL